MRCVCRSCLGQAVWTPVAKAARVTQQAGKLLPKMGACFRAASACAAALALTLTLQGS